MTSTERFAFNYLIFRHPTDYFLMLIPIATGILADVFLQTSRELDPGEFSQDNFIKETLLSVVDNYLFAINIAIIILLGFFISYRWSSMQFSGGYGFWLTLGVNRNRFFLEAFSKILIMFYLAEVIGLVAVLYLNQLSLGIGQIIILNLLILSTLFLQASIAVLLGNTMRNPELGALIFIAFMAANLLFNNNYESTLHSIFRSDLHYRDGTGVLALILSLIVGSVIFFTTMRIHVTYDVET